MRFTYLVATAAAASSLAAAPSFAATIIAGTKTGSNGAPFVGRLSNLRVADTYQQLYTSSLFSGATTITALTFYNSANDDPTSVEQNRVAGGTYTFTLSQSGKTLTTLDLTNFNANRGTNTQQVFSGALSGVTVGIPGQLTIDLASAYVYDPTQGNLLLDIRYNGRTTTDYSFITFDSMNGNSTVFSRATNFAGQTHAVNDGYGLVTGFTTLAAVPEPASWAMLVGGFGTIGTAMRRRRAMVRFA